MTRRQVRHPNQASGDFAAKMREAIGDRTMESIARDADVTLRTVYRWRDGDAEPKGAQLVRLARVLGREPAWFYADNGEST